MNSSLLCGPAVPLEALGSWELIHSCPYPFPLLGEDREAITRVGNLTSLTLAMEGENLGDSALETWPGKVTKSETAKPGDRHHLRGAHRGRREGHRAGSGIAGPAKEEHWMKTKSQGG